MRTMNVAVLGATGMVGQILVEALLKQPFPINKLYLLASQRSAGDRLETNSGVVTILDAATFDFSQVDIAFFSAGGMVSRHYVPRATAAGCVVIDNTSEFRLDPKVPLVIPEVNPETLSRYSETNIIANPNCSTIQMLVALNPIHQINPICRINISTYQAISGAGRLAYDALKRGTQAILANEPFDENAQPLNVIPQIGDFVEKGYTTEEMKLVYETQKILNEPTIEVSPTAARVPVLNGHAEAIQITCRDPIDLRAIEAALSSAKGVLLCPGNTFKTPREATGEDWVAVGRLRVDLFQNNVLNLWCVSDNIRKGAATNSIQIAKLLASEYLLEKKSAVQFATI